MRREIVSNIMLSTLVMKGLEAEFAKTQSLDVLDKDQEFRVVRAYTRDESNDIVTYISVLNYINPPLMGCDCGCNCQHDDCVAENDLYIIDEAAGDIEVFSGITNTEALEVLKDFTEEIGAETMAEFKKLLGGK